MRTGSSKPKIDWLIAAAAFTALTLTGCAVAPLTERGKEHETAIAALIATAGEHGLSEGDGRQGSRQCEVAIDCTPTDFFKYIYEGTEPAGTEKQLCIRFFDFAEEVGFKSWRRDEPEAETTDVTSRVDGEAACVETLEAVPPPQEIDGEVMRSQSAAFVITGEQAGAGAPVRFNAQLSSMRAADGALSYFFLLLTLG